MVLRLIGGALGLAHDSRLALYLQLRNPRCAV